MTYAHRTDGTAIGDPNQIRQYALAAGGFVAALLGGAIVLLWAWNTIAVDLFAAPVVGFRHALAVEVAGVVIGALAGFALRIGRGASSRHALR